MENEAFDRVKVPLVVTVTLRFEPLLLASDFDFDGDGVFVRLPDGDLVPTDGE